MHGCHKDVDESSSGDGLVKRHSRVSRNGKMKKWSIWQQVCWEERKLDHRVGRLKESFALYLGEESGH